MIKIVSLIVMTGVIAATVICRPEWLAENSFLRDFVNHEVVALMAVILTVTLASVANIHLALNRIIARKFNGNHKMISAACEVKKEMNDNAWYIFWGFVFTFVVLLVKGLNSENELVIAIANGLVVWTIFLFVLCMYDIYKVVFGITDLEMSLGGNNGNAEDFSSEAADLGRES